VVLGPTPDNVSTNNPVADAQFGLGERQGLAIANGRIYSVWTGNLNGGSADGKALLDIEGASATYAVGPRIISSTMGPLNPTNLLGLGIPLILAPDGTAVPAGFNVTFDRPINPATFTMALVQVQFMSPDGTVVPLMVTGVSAQDNGPFGATKFRIAFDP